MEQMINESNYNRQYIMTIRVSISFQSAVSFLFFRVLRIDCCGAFGAFSFSSFLFLSFLSHPQIWYFRRVFSRHIKLGEIESVHISRDKTAVNFGKHQRNEKKTRPTYFDVKFFTRNMNSYKIQTHITQFQT